MSGQMPKGYARYALAVMVGINFLNYMDRYVPTAVSPTIQKEFHLDDFQVGILASAFLIVYAVCALPFGYWADRAVRKTVIGVGVTIWSLATLLTGLSQNFTHLFLSRAVVGVGEASYYPAGTSLLGDYYPKHTRGRAMSIWGAGTAFGIASTSSTHPAASARNRIAVMNTSPSNFAESASHTVCLWKGLVSYYNVVVGD